MLKSFQKLKKTTLKLARNQNNSPNTRKLAQEASLQLNNLIQLYKTNKQKATKVAFDTFVRKDK